MEAFWELEAMRLDIGGFEGGKWEAGGCQMEARVRSAGGVRLRFLVWGPWGEDIQEGEYQEKLQATR